ncbi:hypothetical protein SEEN443_21380 [Salmonella enterica subsp. enterica serovar Newport str. CVM 19443]|nr:hypothetical protein SEEN443_21380 [Salmonella enterica subsp. enterica serovar Newport str. CVM 19443]
MPPTALTSPSASSTSVALLSTRPVPSAVVLAATSVPSLMVVPPL